MVEQSCHVAGWRPWSNKCGIGVAGCHGRAIVPRGRLAAVVETLCHLGWLAAMVEQLCHVVDRRLWSKNMPSGWLATVVEQLCHVVGWRPW